LFHENGPFVLGGLWGTIDGLKYNN
jgi:hypothetical protein